MFSNYKYYSLYKQKFPSQSEKCKHVLKTDEDKKFITKIQTTKLN